MFHTIANPSLGIFSRAWNGKWENPVALLAKRHHATAKQSNCETGGRAISRCFAIAFYLVVDAKSRDYPKFQSQNKLCTCFSCRSATVWPSFLFVGTGSSRGEKGDCRNWHYRNCVLHSRYNWAVGVLISRLISRWKCVINHKVVDNCFIVNVSLRDSKFTITRRFRKHKTMYINRKNYCTFKKTF